MRFFVFFLIFFIAAIVGVSLKHDAGYVLIAFNSLTIEMTLPIAILIILLVFALLHNILVFMHYLRTIPTRYCAWRQRRRALRNIPVISPEARNLDMLILLIQTADNQKITEFYKHLPRKLRFNPRIVAPYAEHLIDQQQTKPAELLLRRALYKQNDDVLIHLYGLLYKPTENTDRSLPLSNDVKKMVKKSLHFIESLIKKTPQSAALNLCAARLSNAAKLWGKAQYYLTTSLTLSPTMDAYREQGNLCDQLGDKEGAYLAYQHALNT